MVVYLGAPAGNPPGVFTDCFAYGQDANGAFLTQPVKRVLCSRPGFFICQLGKTKSAFSYYVKQNKFPQISSYNYCT